MKRLTAFVFRHRVLIIAVFVAMTLFFAYWIKDITVNSDVVTYLPKGDAAVTALQPLGRKVRSE